MVVLAAAGGYFAFGRSGGPTADTEATTASAPAVAPPNAPPVASAPGVVPAPPSSGGSPAATGAPKPATPAPVTPPAPEATVTTAAATRASAADAEDAQRELTSIRRTLIDAPEDENVAVGTKSIPRLNQLLPRLGNATDSAWAYIALVTAYGMAERPDRACEPFRNAKRLAATAEQRQNVEGLTRLLTCAP